MERHISNVHFPKKSNVTVKPKKRSRPISSCSSSDSNLIAAKKQRSQALSLSSDSSDFSAAKQKKRSQALSDSSTYESDNVTVNDSISSIVGKLRNRTLASTIDLKFKDSVANSKLTDITEATVSEFDFTLSKRSSRILPKNKFIDDEAREMSDSDDEQSVQVEYYNYSYTYKSGSATVYKYICDLCNKNVQSQQAIEQHIYNDHYTNYQNLQNL